MGQLNCCWGRRYQSIDARPRNTTTHYPTKYVPPFTLKLRPITQSALIFDFASSTYAEDLQTLHERLLYLDRESNIPLWAVNFIHSTSAFNIPLSSYLSSLWVKQKSHDIELKFGSKNIIKAHKLVLEHRCAYFRTMFNSGMQESGQREIEMEEETYDSMLHLIEYFYTDKLNTRSANLLDLMHVIDIYAAEHTLILQQCAFHLYKFQLSSSNIRTVYDFALERNLKELIAVCEYYIILNNIDAKELKDYDLAEMKLRHQQLTLASYDDQDFLASSNDVNQRARIKVSFCGMQRVGKTTLLHCLAGEPFEKNDSYLQTIGIEFSRYSKACQIWDNAGDMRFRSVNRSFLRGTDIVFACFSFDSLESFEHVCEEVLVNDVALCGQGTTVILVGLKHELEHKVSRDDALKLAKQYNCPYHEISVFTDDKQVEFRRHFDNWIRHHSFVEETTLEVALD